jgi:hypothetical protein
VELGDMDVEDFQHQWRTARTLWDRLNQRKLEIEAAGQRLTEPDHASWRAAKARFDEYEQAWDQIYHAGVVIVVGGDDPDDELNDGPGSASLAERAGKGRPSEADRPSPVTSRQNVTAASKEPAGKSRKPSATESTCGQHYTRGRRPNLESPNKSLPCRHGNCSSVIRCPFC